MAEYKLYADRGVLIKRSNSSEQFELESGIPFDYDIAMAVLFSSVDTSRAYKRIVSAKMNAYVDTQISLDGKGLKIEIGLPYESVPIENLTWETAYSDNVILDEFAYSQLISESGYYFAAISPKSIIRAITYGVVLYGNGYPKDVSMHTPYGTNKPYILFDLADDDVGLTISGMSPSAGYISKHRESTFSWRSYRGSYSISEVVPSSTVFRWREGETGTIHTVSIGTDSSITIPADTFTADEIQWSVQITANSGITTTSDWIALSTVEELSRASALSPSGQIIDSQSETLFSWQHVISTGTDQTGFDLQISNDGEKWTLLATETTNRQNYLSAKDTFSAGNLYWRVRTYNSDGAAGEWSDPCMVIVVGAPNTPSVAIESNQPRWAIRWSQQGQQGYEIEFDGEIVASGFGQESRYQFNGWSDPGDHFVRVRIQNEYSMWSDWGAASISIVNQESTAIVLTARQSRVEPASELSWSGESDRYIIYRNGNTVGETTRNDFVDRFGSGICIYQVRGVSDSNGYYTISDPVTVTILPENLMLYDIRNKVWINLARSATQTRDTKETLTRAASFLHFAGSSKPSVEFGEDIDRSITFVCAFVADEYEYKEKFEASVGGMVCLKLPDGESIVGALSAYTRNSTTFYTAYQASVVEAEFDEVASNG